MFQSVTMVVCFLYGDVGGDSLCNGNGHRAHLLPVFKSRTVQIQFPCARMRSVLKYSNGVRGRSSEKVSQRSMM